VGLALPVWGVAANEKGTPPLPTEVLEKSDAQGLPSALIPLYRPPKGSIPGGRLKGGIRGSKDAPVLQVLAPNHVGLTRDKQPTLYWYLCKQSPYPIEFTLVDSRTIPPVVETRLAHPTELGVQRIRLQDYSVNLEEGVPYRWFVSLIVDPSNASKDITAGAIIERVSYIERIILHPANNEDPVELASAGLWYDAIRAISTKIDASPGDPFYRRQRAMLLAQVGLPEVAEFDLRRTCQ
jgi:hypothetical protein